LYLTHPIASAHCSPISDFSPDSSHSFTPLSVSPRPKPNVTSPLSPNRRGVSKSKAPRRERKEVAPKEPKEGLLPKNATPEQFIKYSRWIQQLRAQQQAPTQWTGDDGKVCKDRALNSRLLGKILHANRVREQWKESHPDEWERLKLEYGEDLEDRYKRYFLVYQRNSFIALDLTLFRSTDGLIGHKSDTNAPGQDQGVTL
jgi:hypothetical protein